MTLIGALASEINFVSVLKDAEGLAYLSLQCVAFVSWAHWDRSINS